eukprot:3934313-Rhodomonas_salina.2
MKAWCLTERDSAPVGGVYAGVSGMQMRQSSASYSVAAATRMKNPRRGLRHADGGCDSTVGKPEMRGCEVEGDQGDVMWRQGPRVAGVNGLVLVGGDVVWEKVRGSVEHAYSPKSNTRNRVPVYVRCNRTLGHPAREQRGFRRGPQRACEVGT